MTATLFQLEALRAAVPSGRLRYLSGGFWVAGEYPDVQRGHVPERSLSTHTINACAKRGWFRKESYHTAHLTDAGRQIIAAMVAVDTSEIGERNRIA